MTDEAGPRSEEVPMQNVPLTPEEQSLLERLDQVEAGDAPVQWRAPIERRIEAIALDPDGEGRELPVGEDGRVFCVCGRSVFPENWANHLLGSGTHRATLR